MSKTAPIAKKTSAVTKPAVTKLAVTKLAVTKQAVVSRARVMNPDRPTAWSVWRDLSTLEGATMAASEADRSRMIERHKLVVNIIEINSQQLRCESAKAGADFERARAEQDANLPGASGESRALVVALDQRLSELRAEAQRLETQREFLNATLTEFDGAAGSSDAPAVGRA